MNRLVKPSAQRNLTQDFYADIQRWHEFWKTFNGKRLFLFQQQVEVATDAYHIGAGAVCSGDWLCNYSFCCESSRLSALHINHKEALAVCLAAERWTPVWASKHVLVSCDNQAAVGMVNKGSTGNPLVMQALHRSFWLSAMFDFWRTMQYIPGKINVVAYTVSRLYSVTHLLYFSRFLLLMWSLSIQQHWRDELVRHMPLAPSLFLFTRYRS